MDGCHTGCNVFGWKDTKARYTIKEAYGRDLRFWQNCGMDFGKFPVKYLGHLPYYYYKLVPDIENRKHWLAVDMIAHTILKNETDTQLDPISIYEYMMTHEDCYISQHAMTPCVIHRGGFNETHGLITLHYKRAVLNPPFGAPASYKAPAYAPLTHMPVRILVKPRVTPISIRLNIRTMRQSDTCGKEDGYIFPDLYFKTTGGKNLRRPLQLAAVGSFMLGTALGTLIAGTMTEELRVRINSLEGLQILQHKALSALSSNLDAINIILDKTHAEITNIENQIKSEHEAHTAVEEQFNQALNAYRKLQECRHIDALWESATEEIRTLSQTDIG